MLANGVSAKAIELWDFRGRNSVVINSQTLDRRDHDASLQPDGRVLFTGGDDQTGTPVTVTQMFDPESQTLAAVGSGQPPQESGAALTEMLRM